MSTKIIGLSPKATTRDIKCLLMAKMGFSVKGIAEQCGMDPAEVTKTYRALGIKLKDYRDGTSEFSQSILGVVSDQSAVYGDQLKGEIRKLLAAQKEGPDA